MFAGVLTTLNTARKVSKSRLEKTAYLYTFHLQSQTLKLIDFSFFIGNKQFTFSAEIDFNIKLSEKLILKNVKLAIEIGLENSVEISCSLTNSVPKLEFTGMNIRL